MANTKTPPIKTERVLARASIEGTIRFMRSEPRDPTCGCCDGPHIFCRTVDFDPWKTNHPDHFGNDANILVYAVASDHNEHEGKRVRVTVEVLEDA